MASPLCIGIDFNTNTPDEVIVSAGPGQRLHQQRESTSWAAPTAPLETVEKTMGTPQQSVVVLEATGMAWFPVAAFFTQHPMPVYRVTGQRSHALRQFLAKHAKTDLIDATTLTLLSFLIPDQLDPLQLASKETQALQRWIQRREDYLDRQTAEQNRLQALVSWALPGLVGPTARWTKKSMRSILAKAVNCDWMQTMGRTRFTQWAQRRHSRLSTAACTSLYVAAMEARALYGAHDTAQGYAAAEVEAEVRDYLDELAHLDQRIQQIDAQMQAKNAVVLPEIPLTSLPGTADLTAAVIKAFLGDGSRFPNRRCAEAYIGFIPKTHQSGARNQQGTRIRTDGPAVLKKFLFTAVDTARQWDPQIAATYYREMVEKGNPHTKALCHCVNAYLGRILRVLRTGTPYQFRDVDGRAVSKREARSIVQQQYRVPEAVQKRNRGRVAA